MQTERDVRALLQKIDGRGYKAYKVLRGAYTFSDFTLWIDHVQGDPFAAPSRVRVQVAQAVSQFPEGLFRTRARKIALEDYLTRMFDRAINQTVKGRRGSGKSGRFQIAPCGQEILERSAVNVEARQVEVRFTVGLPARGRSVLGREAQAMLLQELPAIIRRAVCYPRLDADALTRHVEVAEDQDALRQELTQRGLVAWIANGAILPRRSGVDDRPLRASAQEPVVPFQSPPGLDVELSAPNRGALRGMGIPSGVTLIVGGGFHGKSTLLAALERGVYNHIPDDGREYVVAQADACKICSEDGRRVEQVNITPFINNLPFGKETRRFATENASGSTSQAASIMEAVEVGSRLLLIDEDTSATNFMIRDERMQELVAKAKEPITPFVDKVRQLHRDHGVSTILVMGGSGDYFDVADTIIMLDAYAPHDVSDRAHEIIRKHATRREAEGGERFGEISARRPKAGSFDARRGKRDVKIDARGLHTLLYGRTEIDLSGLEQLVDSGQTCTIGDMILYYSQTCAKQGLTLREGLEQMFEQVQRQGLDLLSSRQLGAYAMPRLFEVAAAINRMRTLRCG